MEKIGKILERLKKPFWLSILAILSLPIAIPAAILLIGLLILLILLVLAFLLAALFASIGFFVGGIYFIWEAFTLLSQGLNVFLIGLGFGLSSIGGAVLLYLLTGFFRLLVLDIHQDLLQMDIE